MTVVALRPAAGDADRDFVQTTWMTAYKAGRTGRWRNTSLRRWWEGHAALVASVFDRSSVMIACLPNEPDVTLGWMATEGPCLHFVYVRPNLRRSGIATALRRDVEGRLGKRLRFISHPTNNSRKWLNSWNLIESYAHAFYPPQPEKDPDEQDRQDQAQRPHPQ